MPRTIAAPHSMVLERKGDGVLPCPQSALRIRFSYYYCLTVMTPT